MLVALINGCGFSVAPVSLNPVLPEGRPSAVPISKDIQITNSASNPKKQRYVINGDFTVPMEDIYNYYKNELSGWNLDYDDKTEVDRLTQYAFSFSTEEYNVMIEILQGMDEKEKDRVFINASVKPK